MPLFDTHSHYNLAPIWDHWQEAMRTAATHGIIKAVVIGTDQATNQRALILKQHQPDYFLAALGIQPENALVINDLNVALASLTASPDFDAYGELGLDFYRLDKQAPAFAAIKEKQLLLLRAQLQIALRQPKPIILHVRDAIPDLTDDNNAYGLIIKELHAAGVGELPLVFHCFSGNLAYLQACLAFPRSFISFAGNVTFSNAANLRALLAATTADRLLLETDAPFLSPTPERGRPCEPQFLRYTAQFVAEHFNIDLDTVWENSLRLFDPNVLK